jgi:RHS repeat-associated protein
MKREYLLAAAVLAAASLTAPPASASLNKGSDDDHMADGAGGWCSVDNPDGCRVTVTGGKAVDFDNTVVATYGGQGQKGGESGGTTPGKLPANNNRAPTPADPNTKPDCAQGTAPISDHPVILSTGEKVLYQTDFSSAKIDGLSMDRTYRGFSNSVGIFGTNWVSSFDYGNLVFTGSDTYQGYQMPHTVQVRLPDGSSYTFIHTPNTLYGYTKDGGPWTTATDQWVHYDMDNKWWVLDWREREYRYTPDGRFVSISRRDGGEYLLYVHYDAAGKLHDAEDGGLAQLTFTWTGNVVTQVTDQNKRIWTYGYANGMLQSVTAPGSLHTRQYLYEDTAHKTAVTGIIVDNVRYSTYTYYPSGQVKSSSLANNDESDSFTYGVNTTTMTNYAGEATTFNFVNVLGSLKLSSTSRAATSTCAAGVSHIYYDANGYIDYTLDWNNSKTDYTYNAQGELLDVTTAAGTSLARKQVNTWVPGAFTDVLDNSVFYNASGTAYKKVKYTYATGAIAGRLQSESWMDLVSNQTRLTTYGYTLNLGNNITTQFSVTQNYPTGNAITYYDFDTLGNLTTVINPYHQTISYSGHDGFGNPGTVKEQNGVSTDLVYDATGHLQTATRHAAAGDQITKYSFNGFGNSTGTFYPDGSAIQYQYAPSERLSGIGNALNEYVQYGFTASTNTGTVQSSRMVPTWDGANVHGSASGSFSQTIKYDSLARPYTVQGTHGQVTQYGYDGNGNVTSVADVQGQTTTSTYNADNQVATLQRADGGPAMIYGYQNGYLSSIQDPRGNTTSYTRNGFGVVTNLSSPDSGVTTYSPDNFGRVSTENRADGTSITYSWDALDRLRARTSAGITERYDFDQGTNGIGHLTSVSDATGSTTFGYDDGGHLTSESAIVRSNAINTSWTYYPNGLLHTMTYPNWLVLTYTYDTHGRLAGITSSLTGTSATILSSPLYQPATNLLYAWKFGNGKPNMISQDTDGRVSNITTPALHDLAFSYNPTNTIQGITDSVNTSLSETFNYWPGNKLEYVYRSGDNQSFTVDYADNRTAMSRNGVKSTLNFPTTSNRIANVDGTRSFTYTGSGDIYTDGSRTYSRDAFDRLSQITDAGVVKGSYMYNALGQRVWKNSSLGMSYYAYGANDELTYESSAGVATDYVWWNGVLLGIVRNQVFYAALNDHLGRPEVLMDGQGGIAWRAATAAYDEKTVVNTIGGFNLGFPGQYNDSESLLSYNRNRYYDASIGRYIEADPIGLAGGVNIYAYALSNPIDWVDASGLSSITYDGATHSITLIDGSGSAIGSYPANNNTTRTSGGPWPNGTFPYLYSNPHPESDANGPYGSHGIFVFQVPGRTGMGLHSGRQNSGAQNHQTLGCIRTTDDTMNFLRNFVANDPLTSMTVINNDQNAARTGTGQ